MRPARHFEFETPALERARSKIRLKLDDPTEENNKMDKALKFIRHQGIDGRCIVSKLTNPYSKVSIGI